MVRFIVILKIANQQQQKPSLRARSTSRQYHDFNFNYKLINYFDLCVNHLKLLFDENLKFD